MKFILMSCMIVMTSCNFNKKEIQEDSYTINGKWTLYKVADSVFDINQLSEGKEEFQPYLIFDPNQNKIGGYSGCNTFITNAGFEDSKIQVFDNIAATERICYKNWEADFFGMVEKINNYEINYDTLYINTENNKRLVLLKADKFDLNGNWKLTKINGTPFKKNSKLFANLKNPIIAIDTDKELIYGSTGCANFVSSALFTKISWRQNKGKQNKKEACKNKLEAQIYETLINVTEYSIDNDILVIKSENNADLEFSKIF